MTWPPDYHLHTPLCRHAEGWPVELAVRARSLGLREIGFSDHAPMPDAGFDDWRMGPEELDRYVAEVQRARTEFPELTIRLGLEVDYLPGLEDWIRELAARHPWDYLIGSVHYLDREWAIDNPAQKERWSDRDVADIWRAYAERVRQAADTGLFHILGHLDLCKKFGHRPEGDVREWFRPAMETAARHGTAIELNTAGLRKECREIYPSRDLLVLARECGVAITFGSDAHKPDEVGADFPAALALAREVGYAQSLRFEAGRAVPVPLPSR
ncbi:MAG: histidinol-phosphatase HisJ family protein [Verrucomicrobia bacterium]|nr:MAG: histidinol-phosphatase HisJ family protein [Verrucomicrobiota bacterium]